MSSIRIQSSSRTWSSETARVFRIGRDPGCDIVTDDATVSRAHAEPSARSARAGRWSTSAARWARGSTGSASSAPT